MITVLTIRNLLFESKVKEVVIVLVVKIVTNLAVEDNSKVKEVSNLVLC